MDFSQLQFFLKFTIQFPNLELKPVKTMKKILIRIYFLSIKKITISLKVQVIAIKLMA